MKKRSKIILVFFSIIFIALLGRLIYITTFKGSDYKARSEDQRTTKFQISAKRGRILDRNSNELAINEGIYRLDLDLKTLRESLEDSDMKLAQIADKLSPIIDMKSESILKILNTTTSTGMPANSALLKRQVDKTVVDQVKALKIKGIVISSDIKRYYTNGDFLTSVLGMVNSEGKGASGIEMSYETDLAGTPGSISYEKDARNNQLPYENSKTVEPIDGKDVVLTIDSNIQQFAEKAAQKALTDSKAQAVNIIVMNPKSGEILAMANKPSIDLNTANKITKPEEVQLLWKNPSVQDNFEPGSIFKVITAASALENNIGLNDGYYCTGTFKVDGTEMHCWDLNGHKNETFVDIIKNSCNVGFADLGAKLGKDKLISTSRKLGFGEKTGIDLPGESSGILRTPDKTNKVDLAALSFGQGVAVNQVQYMAAFNAIANGGTWIRPHLMKKVVHTDDSNNQVTDRNFEDYGKKTVYDSGLSAMLRQDLIKVVTEGAGKNAFVQGLDIAGKTGTAQIADPVTGKYAPGKYMSSFVGMAPAADPKITVLVTVNQPGGLAYYAGEVSAPVAKQLFQDIFNYMVFKGEATILN